MTGTYMVNESLYGVGFTGSDSAVSSLSVRSGDTAIWTATASDGYTFAGWYDIDGNLVSSDASYTALATADRTLTARFAQDATPKLATTGSSGDDVDDSAMPTAETGDSALPFELVVIALAAGGAMAIAARRLRGNLHEQTSGPDSKKGRARA